MPLGPKLVLKQTQKLIMTQALQQAIKLLPLARFELIETIRQEMTENPLLDEVSTAEEELGPGSEDDIYKKKEEENHNTPEIDWETYIQNSIDERGSIGNYSDSASTAPPIENTLSKKKSLADHLEWQLDFSAKTRIDKEIGMLIIGNINNEGYLSIDTREIAETSSYSLSDVERVLRLIQSFDPSGVGARNLQECLMLQAEKGSLAETIIKDYREDIENRQYEKIAKKLNTSIDKIIDAVKRIKELSPNPASRFNSEDVHYIVPDVIVVKGRDDYQIILNEDGIPRLKINPFYRKILRNKSNINNPTREYVENKFRSALWLIKSIEQRRNTVLKVSRSIVKFQKNFLDKGVEYLKPLILKDVANDIEMHESTISRVTTNKYMHTPQGLFEFKYFFHSGIESAFGSTMSSVTIKNMIKNIIANEDTNNPTTDLMLVEMLREKDIKIARRTVSKYRKELNISTAHKRKNAIII